MSKLLISRLFLLFMLISGTVQAQDALKKDVARAHNSGVQFKPVQLFQAATGAPHDDVLRQETILSQDVAATYMLYETRPQAIALEMKTADGTIYTLEMLQSNPFAANPNIGYIDNNGRHPFAFDRGAHYQGSVAGAERSIAALSVFANNEVMILFSTEDGNFVAGKLDDNSGNYILYNDKDFLIVPPTQCGTEDLAIEEKEPGTNDKTTASYVCNKVSLYWEMDYQLYVSKQSSSLLAQAYATGLFNQVQTLYRNENIAVELKSLYMWTVDDQYPDGSSHDALNAFTASWNNKSASFDGDIATLLAKDNGGLGGVAWLDIMCNRSLSYAYGDVNGTYSAVPTYSWDVTMLTHEIGHNLGSRHTHWCGWNTGPGGSCGSIDNCTTQQSGSGCSTCPSTFSNAQNGWEGTIMSYCHLVSRGVNLANGFGPLPGDNIRNEVNSQSCLSSIISATLTPTDICKNQGKVDITFNSTIIGSSNFGVSNYNYSWAGIPGGSQNLSVTQPGIYSVTITDSNGCSENFSTTVGIDTSSKCVTTGIFDVDREYVSMYPNPAHDKVMLKFFSETANTTEVHITDIAGRVMQVKLVAVHNGENNVTLDVNGMQAGMYYITLSAPDRQFISLKLIVR